MSNMILSLAMEPMATASLYPRRPAPNSRSEIKRGSQWANLVCFAPDSDRCADIPGPAEKCQSPASLSTRHAGPFNGAEMWKRGAAAGPFRPRSGAALHALETSQRVSLEDGGRPHGGPFCLGCAKKWI